jgi:hypothetical protein
VRNTGGLGTQLQVLLIQFAVKEGHNEIGPFGAGLKARSNIIPVRSQCVRIAIPLRVKHHGDIVRELGRWKRILKALSGRRIHAEIVRQCFGIKEIQVAVSTRKRG